MYAAWEFTRRCLRGRTLPCMRPARMQGKPNVGFSWLWHVAAGHGHSTGTLTEFSPHPLLSHPSPTHAPLCYCFPPQVHTDLQRLVMYLLGGGQRPANIGTHVSLRGRSFAVEGCCRATQA